ncbi:hypothetical protein AWB77_00289 [Caballeronia fortuita]|uniref:Uncharacterized protein n=1 Tax=Caballeronia fortuita TaxID=1777138 RepID=A0A157Z660_9BURK|nr:hypothetical protein [Caballeronia fortuita]SAK40982.1 hypothetical protein AWB77_00289 [Caballeronia fortuita]
MKQISVTLPSDLHPALREFAKRTRDGEPVDSVLREIFPAPPLAVPIVPATSVAPTAPAVISFEARLEMLVGSLPAWRQWILRLLLPPADCPLAAGATSAR